MPIIGLGVRVVTAFELKRIHRAVCPYCAADTDVEIVGDKMHEPKEPCRHYAGTIVDMQGVLSVLFRGSLP